MAWLMDGADVCRTSSRASRRPPDVISAAAILNPRWRRRKWHQPGLGVLFSIPVVAVAQNGGPSASGRHLGWPHLREPEMRSSKMAAGSGRAAILRHRHNGGRKKYPILLPSSRDAALVTRYLTTLISACLNTAKMILPNIFTTKLRTKLTVVALLLTAMIGGMSHKRCQWLPWRVWCHAHGFIVHTRLLDASHM